MDKKETKERYEKPAIVYDEKIEVLAGVCGDVGTEKGEFLVGHNPHYGTPCQSVYS